MRPPSPIELLHPDGFLGESIVVGGAGPDWLRSPLPNRGNERADLVIVAPTHAEARDRRWAREAATSAARAVTPDGLVYVLAPPRRRRAVVRLLAQAGLERTTTLVHLPQLESTRHVVTADRRALRYTLANLLAPSARRRVAAAVAAAPGGSLAFRHIAGTGVVMRLQGARPLLAWLRDLAPPADTSCAILTRTWREIGGAAIVHVFERSGRTPTAVAKVRPAPSEPDEDDEANALGNVAAQARLGGADTPALLATAHLGGRRVLLASAVAGRPAAGALAGHPELVPPLLERVAAWLEAWNRQTYVADGFPVAEIEAHLLGLARALEKHVPDADAYEAWLGELCARLGDAPVPAVAAHNDLTMANVLLGSGRRLGVVDWESAKQRELPLRDLVYATVDAHLVAGRFASRVGAFDACYAGAGEEARAARRYLAHHRSILHLEPLAVVACFHACWLRHAVNDVRRGLGEGSEFVEIVASLVRRRDALAARLES